MGQIVDDDIKYVFKTHRAALTPGITLYKSALFLIY